MLSRASIAVFCFVLSFTLGETSISAVEIFLLETGDDSLGSRLDQLMGSAELGLLLAILLVPIYLIVLAVTRRTWLSFTRARAALFGLVTALSVPLVFRAVVYTKVLFLEDVALEPAGPSYTSVIVVVSTVVVVGIVASRVLRTSADHNDAV